MNKAYKTVWNESTQSFSAVSELAHAHGKSARSVKPAACALAAAIFTAPALAAPIVANGAGHNSITISPESGTAAAANGANNIAIGEGAVADSRQSRIPNSKNAIAIGMKSQALEKEAVALGTESQVKGDQGIAIGHQAKATGWQSVAVGANTHAVGHASVVVGGDDLDPISAAAQSKFKTLTGNNLINPANRYIETQTGEGAVAVGVQAAANGALATAFGTKTTASAASSTALGVGASASLENAVALGAGSQADTNAVSVKQAVINGVTYGGASAADAFAGSLNAAGADNVAQGDQISIGKAGFERQIKHLAPGAITQTSTDAVNGSQLYAVAAKLQNGQTHYYSVNDGGSQKANYNNDGATGIDSLAAGVNAKAAQTNSISIGTNSFAERGSAVAIGSSARILANPNDPNQNRLNAGMAIGSNATVAPSAGSSAMAVGHQARALGGGNNKMAIGNQATSLGTLSAAVGLAAKAHGDTTSAYGSYVQVLGGFDSMAAGSSSAVVKGGNATVNASHQVNGVANSQAAIGSGSITAGKGASAVGSGNMVFGNHSLSLGASGGGSAARMTQALSGNNMNDNAFSIVGGSNNQSVGNRNLIGSTSSNNTVMGNDIKLGASSASVAKQDVRFTVDGLTETLADYTPTFNNTTAIQNAVAIGQAVKISESNTVAIGNTAEAAGLNATALGAEAKALGAQSFAGGQNAKASGANSIAIGGNSTADKGAQAAGTQAIALGYESEAKEEHTIAIGSASKAEQLGAIALGNTAKAAAEDATALGKNSRAEGKTSTAVGNSARALDENATALGNGAEAGQYAATAVGTGANAGAGAAAAFGNDAKAQGWAAAAFGRAATASGAAAVAIGETASASADDTVAIGKGASAGSLKDVALGAGATANGATGTNEAQVNGLKYRGFAGNAPIATVSVGTAGEKRTVTNVAAGRINPTSTDAINGSQLYLTQNVLGNVAKTTKNILGGNAALDSDTGELSMSNIGDTGENTVHDAIKKIGSGWQFNTNGGVNETVKAGDTVSFKNGRNITIANSGKDITVATTPDLTADSLTINGGPVINGSGISNLASGGNTDSNAANIGDVKRLSAAAKTELEGGTNIASIGFRQGMQGQSIYTVNADGASVSAGSAAVSVQRAAKNSSNVTDYAVDLSAASKASLQKAESAVQNVVSTSPNLTAAKGTDGTVTLGFSSDPVFNSVKTGDTTVNGNGLTINGGPSVTKTGINAGSLKITGVEDGDISNTSTDAVNGRQLFAVQNQINRNVAAAKTEVAAGNNVSVDKSRGLNGQDVYTVHAEKTTVSGSSAVSVNPGTRSSTGVTDYAVDLTAQTKANIQKGTDAKTAVDTKGLTFNADSGSTGIRKLGDSLAVNGDGGNISTTADANGIKVAMKDNITVTSVTSGGNVFNAAGLSINGGPTVSASGINAGGKTVSNVAAGTDDNDAVNLAQLRQAALNARTRVEAGQNIQVAERLENGQSVYTVSTADNMQVHSLQAGATNVNGEGVVIASPTPENPDNAVILGANGLNNGGGRITNVSPAENGTDAVNLNQLNNMGNGLRRDIDRVGKKANAGVAGAIAQGSIPQVTRPGATGIGIGSGYYGGQSAIAIGASAMTDSGNWIVKGNVSASTGGRFGVGAGALYQW